MLKWVWLAAGGVTGTFARHFVSAAVYRLAGPSFPYGTLAVNAIGCFAVGFIAALGEGKVPLGYNERLFLVVGFCGAFTTFSAFMLETGTLLDRGNTALGLINVVGNVVVGFAAFRLGLLAGDSL